MPIQECSPVMLGHGQGKRAVTLLTEGGYYYPIISHYSYQDRSRAHSAPQHAGRIRGTRPMHGTTMLIAPGPWTPADGYTTTVKKNFGGSKLLNPVLPPARCRSMHRSQIQLGLTPGAGQQDWNTHYTETFIQKPVVPANQLHLTSLVNRIDQQEGSDMKASIKMDSSPPTYFTQYTRVHSKLGTVLGTGAPREYPVRHEYNVITGETGGPSWREDNRRVSGDKVLQTLRRGNTTILG
ncbi:uncharacterized protein LOC127868422 [Dreissena polymorpha]|uniref:Uncharacterized protein n=1 Tax=Dreissena polymorpha TaxID=45954 RepID=A0A9D4RJW2_DREPO|nr:uncharacterized protein LOC127868422 [Dreissena polymorpha]KAH3871034.1 hypothetical protein DPMN_034228 [Dreissena polymorpha]